MQKFNVIEEMVNVLAVCAIVTVPLQAAKVNLGDFLNYWQCIRVKMEQFVKIPNRLTELPEEIIKAMDIHEPDLLNNEAVVAAMFLDPRHRHRLQDDDDKKRIAKITLANLWRRQQNVNKSIEETQENTSIVVEVPSVEPIEDLDYFMKLVDHSYAQKGIVNVNMKDSTDTPANDMTDIYLILDKFEPLPRGQRMKSSNSVIGFWETEKEANPQLYQLAMVVFAINPTEVRIERDFSALSHIFTNRRCRINMDVLEDILFIHLNRNLFKKVNEEDVKELESSLLL